MTATLSVATATPERLHLVLSNPDGYTVGKLMRTDVNGTRTVRTQAGQLPSTAVGIDFYDHEYALAGGVTYTAYNTANAVIATATLATGRTNLAPNPSFEANITGWTVTPGTGGAASLSNPGVTQAAPNTGAKALRATWTTATTAAGTTFLLSPVTFVPTSPGTVLTASVWARSSVAQRLALRVTWRDAGGATIGTADGAALVTVAGTWTRLSSTGTAPTGTATAQLNLRCPTGTGAVLWAPGDTLDVDGVLVETGTTLGQFFDGNSPYAVWNGTPDASSSHELTTQAQHALVLACPLYPSNGITLSPGSTDGSVPQGITFALSWSSTRATQSRLHPVIGRTDPVVVLRPAATRAGNLTLICPDHLTCEQIESQLSLAQIFQLRQSDVAGLDTYFAVTATDASNLEGLRRWQLVVSLQEINWPAGTFTPVTVWTFADLLAEYGDFNAVAASFASFATLLDKDPL